MASRYPSPVTSSFHSQRLSQTASFTDNVFDGQLPGILQIDMQQAALSDRYVDYANHCLQLAATTTDERSRRMLREMATKWLELAEGALAD